MWFVLCEVGCHFEIHALPILNLELSIIFCEPSPRSKLKTAKKPLRNSQARSNVKCKKNDQKYTAQRPARLPNLTKSVETRKKNGCFTNNRIITHRIPGSRDKIQFRVLPFRALIVFQHVELRNIFCST